MFGVYNMNNWLTLKEASKISGKSVPALRQAVKRGNIEGKKISGLTGNKWVINPDSLEDNYGIKKPQAKHKPEQGEQLTEQEQPEQTVAVIEKTAQLYERLIDEKERLHQEQGRHIETLNVILGDFQGRIKNLEAENKDLDGLIKLLPAPPEEMTHQISDLENKVRRTTSQLQGVTSELTTAREELSVLSSKLEYTARDRDTLCEEKRNLEKECLDLKKKLAEMDTMRGKLNRVLEREEELKKALEKSGKTVLEQKERYEKEIEALRLEISESQGRCSGLLSKIESLKEVKSMIKDEYQAAKEEIEKLKEENSKLASRVVYLEKPWWSRMLTNRAED